MRKLTNKDRRGIAVLVFGMMIVVGGLIVMFAALEVTSLSIIAQDKYLTDPSIPHDQMENASYTITANEMLDMLDTQSVYIYTGSAIVICGYVTLFVSRILVPSRKEDHENNCHSITIFASGPIEYCPVCGIELKRLKKK